MLSAEEEEALARATRERVDAAMAQALADPEPGSDVLGLDRVFAERAS